MRIELKSEDPRQAANTRSEDFLPAVPIGKLVEALQVGDEVAQTLVFNSLYGMLVRIATNKLASMPRNSGDPEVAASSALRSFYCNVKKGGLTFQDRNSLCGFLVKTLGEKVLAQRRRANAMTRQEGRVEGGDALELAAEELSVFTDDFFHELFGQLTLREKQVLEKTLNGVRQIDIAEQLAISERTVQAIIATIKIKLRRA
jgi:ATP/maltotriose-dependent transcriptional regulator MalT